VNFAGTPRTEGTALITLDNIAPGPGTVPCSTPGQALTATVFVIRSYATVPFDGQAGDFKEGLPSVVQVA
jgi:hypothetical protein